MKNLSLIRSSILSVSFVRCVHFLMVALMFPNMDTPKKNCAVQFILQEWDFSTVVMSADRASCTDHRDFINLKNVNLNRIRELYHDTVLHYNKTYNEQRSKYT